MKPAYLIDTDIAIQHLRRVPAVTAHLERIWPSGIGLSLISLGELWEGVLYSRRPVEDQQKLEQFLSIVDLIGINEAICKSFGQIRGQLRKQGNIVADFDLLIGVTARDLDMTLLSNNRKHFVRIPGIRLEGVP